MSKIHETMNNLREVLQNDPTTKLIKLPSEYSDRQEKNDQTFLELLPHMIVNNNQVENLLLQQVPHSQHPASRVVISKFSKQYPSYPSTQVLHQHRY